MKDFVPEQDNNSIDAVGLQHYEVITAEADGTFKYKFKLNITDANSAGRYKVYIKERIL